MSTIRTRLAAATLCAGTLLGLAATAATATPTSPAAASATTATAGQQSPGFWAQKVNLTFVNNTDLTLYYQEDYKSPTHTIAPGKSFYMAGDTTNSSGLTARSADRQLAVAVNAYNHHIGTPSASAVISVDGQVAEGKEHQGTEEFDRITRLGSLEVSSYRHADHDGKNFTMTLTKSGAATTTVDNTASARNTYVYTNGVMNPIHKGSTGPAGSLERGKDAVVQVSNGGAVTDLRVTWQSHQAVFTGFGTSTSLADGESAKFGKVTVTRDDTNAGATTSYTYTVR